MSKCTVYKRVSTSPVAVAAAEADRIAAEKTEADRIAAEKAEADRIAAEKAGQFSESSSRSANIGTCLPDNTVHAQVVK